MHAGGIFYDLGSGTGKNVIAAAVLADFKACFGIELLKGLHDFAMINKCSWDSNVLMEYKPVIDFVHGSILDLSVHNWTDGDIVFANSHCFDVAMIKKLSHLAGILLAPPWQFQFSICVTIL